MTNAVYNGKLVFNPNTCEVLILKIAIVDDDLVFAKNLNRYISELCKLNDTVCSVKIVSPDDAATKTDTLLSFDIIFLDIEMPRVSGIELAEKINELRGVSSTPYIIFVTAKDNLVFDALKKFPYSFVRKSHLEEIESCLQSLFKKISHTPAYSIKIGRDIKALEIKNIIYLEKQGNYTAFYTAGGVFQERSVIDEKQRDLQEYGFVRPNIGHLVNAAHITDFSGTSLRLSCGKEVSVSRNYKQRLKAEFNEWLVKTK